MHAISQYYSGGKLNIALEAKSVILYHGRKNKKIQVIVNLLIWFGGFYTHKYKFEIVLHINYIWND